MPLMFLNGTAMSGMADHHLVGDAPLVAKTRTAPRYRFWAVNAGDARSAGAPLGAYPGLEDVGSGGAAVLGEVYDLSWRQLREVLLPGEPPGLELGAIELADGTGSLAMVLRREHTALPCTDITDLASWRDYLHS
ncbi:gamma-glutamylcyclotransferase [Pseudonocardia eucalypti]|uniref:Gamma-glutamylcyclotransferase n=1 Tax=Pseudonocardia eucalypti TaxID=648755 RepID=A0ABP9PK68_9PSEU|nr:hypothetical protein [Pseudonocardia eucalypti]